MAKNIRNFSIIAHIDHGKSTLADRFLEKTGAVTSREMMSQYLDSMDLERERGITIKAQTARLKYTSLEGVEYTLNLIDTPGHVDFQYEVSRSLAACEGVLLVVDCSQGVEAQTVANTYLAVDQGLEIIPVFNKIDLPNADPESTRRQLEEIIGLDASEAILCSAKEGIGIEQIFEAIVKKIPPPSGLDESPLRALIFDSWYDSYRGVVLLIKVVDGMVKTGSEIALMSTGNRFEVQELGVFTPKPLLVDSLGAGEVGYLIASIKNIRDVRVGDTITDARMPAKQPIKGFKPAKPMVFSGIYPADTSNFEDLRDSLGKLALNDASLNYEAETSLALGFGFRCGFLGLFHMEIIQERLEREYKLDIVTTAPTVVYRVTDTDGNVMEIDNPHKLPPPHKVAFIEEPIVRAQLHLPSEFLGNILRLCNERRGLQKEMKFLASNRVVITYELPLQEIVFDFFDKLKGLSKGFASFDYELIGFRRDNLVKLDILVNGVVVDALSCIMHRDKAYYKGKEIVSKLRSVIPRQQFEVALQAAIGSKVIARENVKPYRKNVLAKCYGGDITRKRKLLEKQKEGKKRMKQVGNVEIPQEAFLAILKV